MPQNITNHQKLHRVAVSIRHVVERERNERVRQRREYVADGERDEQNVQRGHDRVAFEHYYGHDVSDAAQKRDQHEHDAPKHVALLTVYDRLVLQVRLHAYRVFLRFA